MFHMDSRLTFSCGLALGACIYAAVSYYYDNNELSLKNKKQAKEIPEEIRDELYSRSVSFFGPENFKSLQSGLVIVVGLGGVGSHAAHMLCRIGVTRLRLIDFDQVSLSSLNRNALATLQDVGTPKVVAMKNRLLQIVPWCEIEAINEMFKDTAASSLLSGGPIYVLDCIDDVSTKAALIAYCVDHKIKVLTSMGAGGKADPTKIKIGTLKDCVRDPLASKIKWKLKSYNVVPDDVMAIYSSEKPVRDLMPLTDEQKEAPQEFGAIDYFRLRVMPVLGTSPAMFGQAMASYVVCSLTNCQYLPDSCEPMSKNLRHKMLMALRKCEMRRFQDSTSLDIDDDELEFAVHQVWGGRCAVTDRRIGGNTGLVLTRWDSGELPTVFNLVLLAPHVADDLAARGHDAIPAESASAIHRRLAWAKVMCRET